MPSPRDYYTGTNSVEALSYVAEAPPGEPACVPGLRIPAGTARIQVQLISQTRARPALQMALMLTGVRRTIEGRLRPVRVGANRVSTAVFAAPGLTGVRSETPASLCLRSAGAVNWGGTPLPAPPSTNAPTVAGHPVAGRMAVWYLPPAGSRRSYLSHAGQILSRASLFRPRLVGAWLYIVILALVLPLLALASVRCLALASAQSSGGLRARRMGLWLFAIAACNFACWAVITPAFQAPDEVDHFAYTQSLVQRGEAPAGTRPRHWQRWSGAEALLLEDTSFSTDHRSGTAACHGRATSSANTARRPAGFVPALPTEAATRPRRPTVRSTTPRSRRRTCSPRARRWTS